MMPMHPTQDVDRRRLNLPMLAIVLITKDQTWNVDRLVGSVLRETAALGSTEVVLVDSNSVDGTAAAAARHPIEVLRLQGGQPLTPAAGRYVGYLRTTAPLVLFLDGDMELWPGWLEEALGTMQRRADVGVLAGPILDLLPTAGAEAKPGLQPASGARPREILYANGAALYRRAALEEAGTFNPYLHSEEEPELCMRIRRAGYRVVELDCPIAYHYSRPSSTLSGLIGRWRRNLFLGAGEVIRYHLGDELLWPYVRDRGYGLVPGIGGAVGLAALLGTRRTGTRAWFALWCGALLAFLSIDVRRKGSLYGTVHSLLHRLFLVDGTLRGFLARPHEPHSYPARFETIRGGD